MLWAIPANINNCSQLNFSNTLPKMKICEMATTVWPANMMGKCKNKIQPIFELFINQKIESIEMGQTCKSKQLFWTVHNSNFQKLYLRWKFVKWPPLFGQQTWWGNEPGWWRKLWSTIPDRSLGTQGTPNVEDPAKANKFWATIHIYTRKPISVTEMDLQFM